MRDFLLGTKPPPPQPDSAFKAFKELTEELKSRCAGLL